MLAALRYYQGTEDAYSHINTYPNWTGYDWVENSTASAAAAGTWAYLFELDAGPLSFPDSGV